MTIESGTDSKRIFLETSFHMHGISSFLESLQKVCTPHRYTELEPLINDFQSAVYSKFNTAYILLLGNKGSQKKQRFKRQRWRRKKETNVEVTCLKSNIYVQIKVNLKIPFV